MMIMNSFYHNRKESDPANRQQTKPSSDPAQNAIDQAWAEEVERRCIAVDSGKAKLIPGEEVFEKIKKRFSK